MGISQQTVMPVSYSLLAAHALMSEVAHAYSVKPQQCLLMRSWVNDAYLIVTAASRYVLKVYRFGWRSPEDVAWEVDLISHLAARGAPVAPAIPRRDGGMVTAVRAPEGTRSMVLYAYADGAKPLPPFTPELYGYFGRATATIHRASDDFVSRHWRTPHDLNYMVDQPLAVIRPHLAHRPADWNVVVEIAAIVRSRIESLAARGLDWGPCHGDVTLDNLHVTDDHRIIFYDFDSGGPGWRASDPYGVFATRPPERWEAFLAGYTEIRPFGPVDRAAVPYFVMTDEIWGLAQNISNWSRWSGLWMTSQDRLATQIATWRQWIRNTAAG